MADFDDILNIGIEEPKRRMGDYSYTFYGVGGFGKSSIAAKFKDALFFQFEMGQNALRARKQPISNWKEFKDFNAKLKKAKDAGHKIPYRNFIIDTADVAWKFCTHYVCRKNGWDHPSDAEWGKGWEAVGDEWFFELDTLSKLGDTDDPCTTINILHETEKEFKPNNRDSYHKTVMNIPKGGRAVVFDKVDFVVYCGIDQVKNGEGGYDDVRVMYVRDNGIHEAKSRLRYMPSSIKYGADANEAYDNFSKAFKNAVIEEFGEEEAKETPSKPDKSSKKKEKVEKKVEEPVQEAESNPTESPELDKVKKEVESVFMELYKSKKKTANELVAVVEEYTGVKKISDIDDIAKAQELLVALKG